MMRNSNSLSKNSSTEFLDKDVFFNNQVKYDKSSLIKRLSKVN